MGVKHKDGKGPKVGNNCDIAGECATALQKKKKKTRIEIAPKIA